MMCRILRVFLFLSFIVFSISVSAETLITPSFSVGALQGVVYNNHKSIRSYFLIDESQLYITNEKWELQHSYTIDSGLKDLTFQLGLRSVFILNDARQLLQFNIDTETLVNTFDIPVTNSLGEEIVNLETDDFVALTKAGKYFYVVTTNHILKVRRNYSDLVLEDYWTINSFHFTGAEYSYWEGKLYFTDADTNTIHTILLEDLNQVSTGEVVNPSLFTSYYIPSENAEGLCLAKGWIIFVENTGNIVASWQRTLFSEARQEELRPKNNGLLIGFWGLNGYQTIEGLQDIQERFGDTVFQVNSTFPKWTVESFLPMVRDSGMKVALSFTGYHENYTTDGNFDMQKWMDKLSVWKDSGVQEFIDDGTLVANMMLDDINNFPGNDPTAGEFEEMARYSHEILPNLMTYVRAEASSMPIPDSGKYEYVDAVLNQYLASKGDVVEYAQNQADTAEELGLDILNGLNICDGGNGDSNQMGWRSNKYAMTAEEIKTYGKALLAVPHLKMFLLWEYDAIEVWPDGTIGADYFDQPEIQQALAELGKLAAEYSND